MPPRIAVPCIDPAAESQRMHWFSLPPSSAIRFRQRSRFARSTSRSSRDTIDCSACERAGGEGADASAARFAFVIRNRWPSGAMSRWRPGTAGLKKPGVSKSLLGGSAANVELLVGETRIEAQIDS